MSGTHPIHDPEAAIERLGGLPGGPELLAAARRREDIALVGGAVRDLLLGHWPKELDVTVEGHSGVLAEELARSISPSERPYGRPVEPVLHERFATASLRWAYGKIDIAELRVESYPAPGALPEVRPGSVQEDLARRDFTINAIALPLAGEDRGTTRAVDHALEDLAGGLLRVLHDRSFIDDPTRLLRLARYQARLGFQIEAHTLALAEEALSGGALATVSGARISSELWLCAEETATDCLTALGELGVLERLGLRARFDEELHQEAVALMPHDGDGRVLKLAVLLRDPDPERTVGSAGSFELFADTRPGVLEAVVGVDELAARLDPATPPSQLRGLLAGRPAEALALAGALAARRTPGARGMIERWLSELRHVRLQIDGEDLLAAGVEQGPEVGLRLERALAARLDGDLEAGREAELRAALEAEL